jgi:hypothetical protein
MARQTKQNKLDSVLKARTPLERQAVKPVDVLETERPNRSDEPTGNTDRANRPSEVKGRPETPTERTEQGNRSSEPNNRTPEPFGRTDRANRTVYDELQEGQIEEDKRATERYSFEIYIDQKGSIEELQYLYKKKTGKKLTASRIIREAIEEYLERALQAFRE